MANNPKSSKDPTELALSAIEDALNVRSPDESSPRRPPGAPANQNESALDRARSLPREEREERAEVRLAANDDRESVGQLLRALQRRPSRTPMLVAWLFTVAWVICAAGLALGAYGPELGALLGRGVSSGPLLLGLIAGFFAPIVFFFVLAHMLTRAREMRLVGQSMAEIAIRLAEPETLAR